MELACLKRFVLDRPASDQQANRSLVFKGSALQALGVHAYVLYVHAHSVHSKHKMYKGASQCCICILAHTMLWKGLSVI
jgi:hypothetical protein